MRIKFSKLIVAALAILGLAALSACTGSEDTELSQKTQAMDETLYQRMMQLAQKLEALGACIESRGLSSAGKEVTEQLMDAAIDVGRFCPRAGREIAEEATARSLQKSATKAAVERCEQAAYRIAGRAIKCIFVPLAVADIILTNPDVCQAAEPDWGDGLWTLEQLVASLEMYTTALEGHLTSFADVQSELQNAEEYLNQYYGGSCCPGVDDCEEGFTCEGANVSTCSIGGGACCSYSDCPPDPEGFECSSGSEGLCEGDPDEIAYWQAEVDRLREELEYHEYMIGHYQFRIPDTCENAVQNASDELIRDLQELAPMFEEVEANTQEQQEILDEADVELDLIGCDEGCGNGTCDEGEDCNSCPLDCPDCPSYDGGSGGGSGEDCGDGICDEGEDCYSCPLDCPDCPSYDGGTGGGSDEDCGDGICDESEDCYSCPLDCQECP